MAHPTTTAAADAADYTDPWDYLPGHLPGGIRCGNHQGETDVIRHATVADVRRCHAITHAWELEAAAEAWAENAWLRAAEAGNPDTWRAEELERMAEASGLPIPPGMF